MRRAALTAAPPLRRRALTAVALLGGLYVLGGAVIAACIGVNVALFVWGDRYVPALVFAAGATIFGVVRGLLAVERRQPDVPAGIRVDASTQPALVALVAEVARTLGTAEPSRLYLVPEVNAYVHQRGRLLGLVPGRRVMAIGVGLLQVTDVDGLRAVVAHELGHYSGGDTRLGPVVYRGSAAISRVVGRLGPDGVGALFAAYGGLYERVTLAVRRSQEVAADRAAGSVAGPAAVARTLVAIDIGADAFDRYLAEYVHPAWSRGRHPFDVYGGFRCLLADETRRQELEATWSHRPTTAGPFDSHPSTHERLAALGVDHTGLTGPSSAIPARALLRDADTVEAVVAQELARVVTGGAALQPLAWESFGAAVVHPALASRGQAILAAVAAVNPASPPSLNGLLNLLAAGRADDLLQHLVPRWLSIPAAARRAEAARLLTPALAGLLAEALCVSGGAWRLSWSGPAEFVAAGSRWPIWELAEQATAGPDGARAVRCELAATDGDPSAAGAASLR